MTEHTRVIQCSCGETFNSEDKFDRHKKAERRRTFNQKAQQWLDDHLGGEIANWHEELMNGPTGGGAYFTAQHYDEIGLEPTHENVRDAAIQFAKDSLTDGNKEELFYEEFHEE